MTPTPGDGQAPPPALPRRYLVAATLAFVAAAVAVPALAPELAGHYYHPRILALTHVMTLGWITLAIMGTSYQLVPIIFERPLWSARLARWQFIAFIVGAAGIVSHFFIGEWSGLVWAAGVLLLAVAAHVVNVAVSLRGPARRTLAARLMAMALVGLAATATFGALLGVQHVRAFLPVDFFAALHAHVHLALLGWVAPALMGVAARVCPLLAREPDGVLGSVQVWGLGLGVPVLIAGLLVGHGLIVAGALAVTAALAAHAVWIARIARAPGRPRLDWGLRFVLTATAFLVPATLLGLALAFDVVSGPRAGLAYAVLALGGWVSLSIVGMIVTMVSSWPLVEGIAYASLTGGVLALAGALAAGELAWIRGAGALVAAGAGAFGLAVLRALPHVPRSAPRVAAAPPALRTS